MGVAPLSARNDLPQEDRLGVGFPCKVLIVYEKLSKLLEGGNMGDYIGELGV